MSEEEERPRPRQRSVHCPVKTQAFIRTRARAAGQSISRYVLELARADDPGRFALVVAAKERRALLEGMRNVDGTLRALRAPLPGCGGLRQRRSCHPGGVHTNRAMHEPMGSWRRP